MNTRRLRRYVDDLLAGRRPRGFPPDHDGAADIRTRSRCGRPGRAGRPRDDSPAASCPALLWRGQHHAPLTCNPNGYPCGHH
jgi:hypothetical protein